MNYSVSPPAQSDLDAIWDYIAADNPAAADRLMEMSRASFRRLDGISPLL